MPSWPQLLDRDISSGKDLVDFILICELGVCGLFSALLMIIDCTLHSYDMSMTLMIDDWCCDDVVKIVLMIILRSYRNDVERYCYAIDDKIMLFMLMRWYW